MTSWEHPDDTFGQSSHPSSAPSLVIHKYTLRVTDEQVVRTHSLRKWLAPGLDAADNLCLWALVAITKPEPTHVHRISIVGTGNPFPNNIAPNDYIGTVTMGAFVWHVFEAR